VSTIEQFHSKSNKYRVLLLADINSSHIQKWALSLAENGIEIGLFSFSKLKQDWIRGKENIHILFTPDEQDVPKILSKAIYPFLLPDLKRAIKEFKPDILHAHYASSYGLIGALAGFHPFIISVWGSDVFNFPKISPMHKRLLKFNLRKADKICSTSHIMKEETKKYTNKEISVIPFGIDLNIYKPFHAHHVFNDDAIVIGTVKALEEKYGIAYLIDAFALLRKRVKSYPLKLLIVGKGSLDIDLKRKVKDFGIESDVVFTGYIPPAEIPFYQNMLTIAVFPSIDKSESFGVSAVEAMACEKPVVVSNIGGLPEVVEAGVTGLIVPPANAEKLAETLEILVKDEQLRDKLGKLGRSRVAKLYNWENNLADMIRIYKALIAEKSK
jgi:glycosyltransferase involved in cell wall biosynthesis